MKKIFLKREFILIIIILIIIAINGILIKNFFTLENQTIIFLDVSLTSIVAVGLTLLLIIGEMDVSLGANLAFLSMFLGLLLKNGVNIFLSILLTIILGILVGFFIGLIVSKFDIDSFVVTIGMVFILEGVSFLIGYNSKVAQQYAASFGGFPVKFLKISTTKVFGIEMLNFYVIVIVIIIGILLFKNVFFRNIFYIGGNRKSARLLGIKYNLMIIFTFVLLSTLIAISAVLRASRYNAANASLGGMTFTLKVITAAIIGGCSLKGGRGSIIGTILGVTLFAVLNNGMSNIGINPIYFNLIIGIILLFTVAYEIFLNIPSRLSSRRLK